MPKFKTITIEQYQQMQHDYAGLCLACGDEAYGVEPDAQRSPCECCGKNAVFGPHEFLVRGFVQ